MVQGARSPGLAMESTQALGVLGNLRGQRFEGHLPIETCIPRAVHLAHAAGAQRGSDLAGPRRACRKSHGGELKS
jgi:hypothetical protein